MAVFEPVWCASKAKTWQQYVDSFRIFDPFFMADTTVTIRYLAMVPFAGSSAQYTATSAQYTAYIYTIAIHYELFHLFSCYR